MNSSSSNLWSTGLLDCSTDVSTCCMTIWCPCVTFGRIAEILDEGRTSCCASGTIYALLHAFIVLSPLYSCSYRSKLKHQYSFKPSACKDCLVSFCCERCALCQEYRELENRGFNMSIGWKRNVESNTRVAMAPVMEGGMKR